MIKAIPIKNTKLESEKDRLDGLLTLYLLTLDFYFDKIKLFKEKIPRSSRERQYQRLKPKLKKLKGIFKEIVLQRNKIATLKGYSNHLELFLSESGIPRSKYKYFLQSIDRFISTVNEDLPKEELKSKIGNWDMFNIPFPHAKLIFPEPFNEPQEILSGISRYSPRFKRYKNKEKIRFGFGESEFTSSTRYVSEKDIVEIKLAKNLGKSTDRTLVLVHEVGHALVLLDKKSKKKQNNNIDHLARYYMEFEANKFTYGFIKKTMGNKAQKIIKYNLLEIIAMALFEIDIYSDHRHDPDQVFAKTINRCYLKAQQTRNPFYVLDRKLALFPLENLLHSISYLELYL